MSRLSLVHHIYLDHFRPYTVWFGKISQTKIETLTNHKQVPEWPHHRSDPDQWPHLNRLFARP